MVVDAEREAGSQNHQALSGPLAASRPPAPTLPEALTAERFARIFPRIKPSLQDRYYRATVAACTRFRITTPERLSAFLAQVAHESGGLLWLAEIWGPTAAQERYGQRADLGNVMPGDGERFKGRGPLQITGRLNYATVGQALGLPLEREPELLEEIEHGMEAAAWWWAKHNLNSLADVGEFDRITRTINGGATGLPDRWRRYQTVRRILGL